jgi:hypothetical protein
MAYHWLDLNIGRPTIGWFFNSKQERVRLVGFKYQKADDWLDLNSKQEGLRLVGIKYQKGYDWLDSKFPCSYIESPAFILTGRVYLVENVYGTKVSISILL